MEDLGSVLDRLTPTHRYALGWFLDHAGQHVSWPRPIEVGGQKIDLAVTAMGIYKPKWTKYALSVWQSLGGKYPDQAPMPRPDGSWTYGYYQQNADASRRDDFFTNRGLMQCLADRVPVGVFRQVKSKPNPLYEIQGIAMVSSWEEGFFWLEGFNKDRRVRPRGPQAEMDFFRGLLDQRKLRIGDVDPENLIDARKRIVASIVLREGQREFRDTVLAAYENRCAITRYDAPQALEAAHIFPYQGPRTNDPSNGLLLRSDLHTLFDKGLIAIETRSMKIVLKDDLLKTSYGNLLDAELATPKDPALQPSLLLLTRHREWAGF